MATSLQKVQRPVTSSRNGVAASGHTLGETMEKESQLWMRLLAAWSLEGRASRATIGVIPGDAAPN